MNHGTYAERQWQEFNARAAALKDPNLATMWFGDWFASLDEEARRPVTVLLCKWALSSNEPQQFDALALAGRFQLVECVPALETLAGALRDDQTPQGRFLRLQVLRLLADFLEIKARDPEKYY